MGYIYHNITGNSAQTLFQGNTSLKNINITNTHGADSVRVSVYLTYLSSEQMGSSNAALYKGSTSVGATNNTIETTFKYHIIKNVLIPYGTTLVLEEEDLQYDTNYNLVIELSESDSSVDLIIRDKSNLDSNLSRAKREHKRVARASSFSAVEGNDPYSDITNPPDELKLKYDAEYRSHDQATVTDEDL